MGIEYEVVQADRKQVKGVTCDRCGRGIPKTGDGGWNQCGEPHSVYHEPSFRDFFLLDKAWGYDSGKDTERHRAAICEGCYDEILKGVNVQITRYM